MRGLFICFSFFGLTTFSLAQISIVEPNSYQVDDSPIHFQTGDFNEDGFVDIVTANFDASSENLSILINDQIGGFDDRTDINLTNGPYEVVIADVNGDGHQDIAATIQANDEVAVLLGDGSGNFSSPNYFTTGTGATPNGLVITDVNSDSFNDIITANRGTDDIAILLGDGAGMFSAPSQVATGNGCRDIVASFFNADAFIDLAVVNPIDENIIVLYGDGTGAFPTSTTISSITNDVDYLELSDLNDDGNIDILGFGSGTFITSLGSGSGTFGAPTFYNYPRGRGNVGDLDGDGNLDVVFATDGQALYTMKGDGTGALAYDVKYYFNNSSPNEGSEIVDIDNDGDNDIISLGSASTSAMNRVTVLKNNNSGVFDAPTMYSLLPSSGNIEGTYAIVSDDFNEDGFVDIADTNHEEDQMALIFGDGLGQFTQPIIFNTGDDPRDLIAGDINNDGHLDLLTLNWLSDNITLHTGDGTGNFIISGSIGTLGTALAFDLADVDEDNNLDIIVANGSGNSISLYLGNGAGAFSSSGTLATSVAVNDVRIGDFNNSGFADIAASLNASDQVVIFTGNGAGAFTETDTYDTFGATTLETGDLNLDGNIDLLIGGANPVSGSALVLIGAGDGTFSPLTVDGISGTTTTHMFAKDMNGDGQGELIRSSQSPSSALGGGIVSVNGLNASLDLVTEVWEGGIVGGWKMVIEDFNQDGLPDIATADVNYNGIWVLINNSVSSCVPPTIFNSTDASVTLCEGDNTALGISVTGDSPSYTWLKDGNPISGANASNLNLTDVTISGAGTYLVEVMNACGTDQLTFSVTINSTPNNPIITDGTGCANTSVSLTASGTTNGNYRWYDVPSGGTPLPGETSATFTTPALSTSTSYYVSILENNCESSRVEGVANVLDLATIISQPQNQTVNSSEEATFSISATGANLSYQWLKDGSPQNNESDPSLVINSATISDQGLYSCVVENSCNSITSNEVSLTVSDPNSGFSVIDGSQNQVINNAQQVAIQFDPATAGTTSSRTFTINNTGQTTIQINEINIAGDDEFFLGTIPSEVPVSGSENFQVLAESQAAGMFSASVLIETNIGNFIFPVAILFADPSTVGALLVYNAVAPNGNGKHDFLKIENIELKTNNSVQIFNRWGDKVYEASGYNNQSTRFEGVGNVGSAGKLTEGTYFYMIKTENEELTGFLFLRR